MPTILNDFHILLNINIVVVQPPVLLAVGGHQSARSQGALQHQVGSMCTINVLYLPLTDCTPVHTV